MSAERGGAWRALRSDSRAGRTRFIDLPMVAMAAITLLLSSALASASGGLLVNHDDIARVRAGLEAEVPRLVAARDALVEEAEAALEVPVRPVTAGKENGERVAPNGDPNEYVSLSPYWWPNPRAEDGLPYIRRDGRVNPERHEYDTPKLGEFGKAVRVLGFAYAVTDDERYARRAAEHLRAWFITPETRMHPRMRYAQFVPGRSDGRAVGIIDTNRLRWVPDAMLLLEGSPHWPESDAREAKRWFSEYLDWLLTSELGRQERAAKNNHGTWFDCQAVLYARIAGREDVALEVLRGVPARIAAHIEPDGSQPHEMARTTSLGYCEFNARGLMDLATHGEALGVDLAGFETADGRSIRRAVDFIVPAMIGQEEWTYEQIRTPRYHMMYQSLRRAALLWDDGRYARAAALLPDLPRDLLWIDLILPARPEHYELGDLGG